LGKAPNNNHRYVEIPSLEEIEEMDRLKQKATESLEIDFEKNTVRCQNCNSLQPVMQKESSLSGGDRYRIDILRRRIEYIKKQHPANYRLECKKEEEELQQLLEARKKNEILKCIPLHSSRMSDFKFLCGPCYDGLYTSVYIKNNRQGKQKEEEGGSSS
jgi:DNA polymerase III delta prime subunit